MKERPILILAIILSIAVELLLIVLVYHKISVERLPSQIGRLSVQLILILWLLSTNSNKALFLLAAYHIVSGLLGLYSNGAIGLLSQILIGYHFCTGLVIYFHDSIEDTLK